MTNILCDWMTCIYNTSKEPQVAGYCKLNQIELKQIEEEDDYSVDGLHCSNYKREKSWISISCLPSCVDTQVV